MLLGIGGRKLPIAGLCQLSLLRLVHGEAEADNNFSSSFFSFSPPLFWGEGFWMSGAEPSEEKRASFLFWGVLRIGIGIRSSRSINHKVRMKWLHLGRQFSCIQCPGDNLMIGVFFLIFQLYIIDIMYVWRSYRFIKITYLTNHTGYSNECIVITIALNHFRI